MNNLSFIGPELPLYRGRLKGNRLHTHPGKGWLRVWLGTSCKYCVLHRIRKPAIDPCNDILCIEGRESEYAFLTLRLTLTSGGVALGLSP